MVKMGQNKLIKQIIETFVFTADQRLGLFWRLLVYLFLFMLVLGTAQGALVSLDERELTFPKMIGGVFYLIVASAGIIGITALSRRFLDRRPWQAIGLSHIGKNIPQILFGWFAACAMIGLVFAIEYALGWVRIEGNEVAVSGWSFVLDRIVGGLLLRFAIGVTEEIVFRGYVFQNLGEQYPVWFSSLITGLLFAFIHGNVGVGYLVGCVLISTFLIMTRLATGTLWFAIAFHGGWNWMQSQVLGLMHVNTPAYGHALLHLSQRGPELFVGRAPAIEGGLIILGLMVVALGGIWFYMRRMQPAVSWNSYLASTGGPIPAGFVGRGEAQELGDRGDY
jgi:membrane protease YdiL (CAAX protease family)